MKAIVVSLFLLLNSFTRKQASKLLNVNNITAIFKIQIMMTRSYSLGEFLLEGFDVAQPGQWKLNNDGHSVVLDVGGGLSVSGGGLPGVYHTIQLHFHWGSPSSNGSEHTVDGQRYPMEMHIVNMKSTHPNVSVALGDPTGLAVLGVFVDVSSNALTLYRGDILNWKL
uniref:Carbonic anhydrase n=1 Tax=Gadus morhua TaxID=8049 RepID=A0A8C5BU17_GADMO